TQPASLTTWSLYPDPLPVTACPWLRSSPLLPYTTLFRSAPAPRRAAPDPREPAPAPRGTPLGSRGSGTPPTRGRVRRPAAGARRDRKSTRLNSSHVSSSYAVFCVKKITMALTPFKPELEF